MQHTQKILIPLAIVVAGIAIAFGVYYSNVHPQTPSTSKAAQAIKNIAIPPITDTDHIRGSKDAKLIIVEYSDTECPYCKAYHAALKQIYIDYSKDSKVAWVYRPFPLVELHSKAPKEAEALECAGELGGQNIFWDYTDEIFAETPSNDGLEPLVLPQIADKVGIDVKAFNTCLSSGKYAHKIQESVDATLALGAVGTPYTVLILKTATKTETIPLVDSNGESIGALPYDALHAIVEKLINS